MYKDDRRTYFPPIETDTNATIEIDFMLLPTIPINPVSGQLENGDQFANSKYGLIVSDNSNMSRATFLPHVFPDTILWKDIKGKVISKAGATTSNTNNKFLAYQIKQIKAKLFTHKPVQKRKTKRLYNKEKLKTKIFVKNFNIKKY